ncbi:hypothetical protein AK88_04265 [Plasmodium fragile]|uniref:Schizont-infected cell agglutination C-terminal domain-containing protein n=1 Tax=Plasmodium fragile TaxID=5857 RepID=A0A0D9QGF4_PLAFR|nr:uncharacterized protein AK88_04265 [Plasmodium fragile]KJP86074.1 hypothetical protein AK88_04265 [Plasmodium fragile]
MALVLGHILAQYVKDRGLVDKPQQYQEFLGKDVTALLDEFVGYMENEELDIYASNCLNKGYTKENHGETKFVANVGDRIMCTLMSRALFFMNAWSSKSAGSQTTDPNNAALKEHIRCAIVNIFMYILNESTCRSKMGVYYAWETMKELESGQPGLLTKGTCRQGLFQNIKIQDFDMGEKIKDWLKNKPSLTKKFAGKGIQSICKKSIHELVGKTQDENAMGGPIELKNEEQAAIRELGQGLKTIVEEVKKAAVQCAKDHDACIESIQHVSSSDPQGADSKATVSNSVDSGTPAPSGNEGGTESSQPATGTPSKASPAEDSVGTPPGSTTSARGSQPQAPASPELPSVPQAPASPVPSSPPASISPQGAPSPASSGTGITSNAATTPAPKQASKDSPASVSVSFIQQTPSSDCSGTAGTVPAPPRETEAAPGAPSNEGATGKSSETTRTSPEAGTPSTGRAGDGNTSGTNDAASGDAVVDGGNDDPPPPGGTWNDGNDFWSVLDTDPNLWGIGKNNPDKPASASGTSGASGGASSEDSGQFQFNFPSPALNIEGATGGFVPPVPADGEVSSSGETPRDYAVPDLTNTVLTATTPLLFFLSAVTVALLGYSLWKYFAYLGHKRRRTYRTVRDVPSPPLDEDILDHLQRGELPPPDYGYTMVRERRRDKFADRRRRAPRVHKRTIIELHLEVLNECEEAEWENVKDEFYGILVEEFMGGNNGHSSSPDNAIPNDGLPGNNVSSTVDPPTDIARTDPCPPNEQDQCSCMETIPLETDPCAPNDCDPWRCMENIRLATHPCAPNEEHPDPWKCMETIQLETGPCVPTDDNPDPWSCMETIQLATDTSPPKDPDPWSCMENIQLPTDPCPPNEHDPDPWCCMETIQLETDPCPPNEDEPDPWSCMETIQLATDRAAPNEQDRWNCMENIQLPTHPCRPHDPDPWNCMESIQLEQEETPFLLPSPYPGN